MMTDTSITIESFQKNLERLFAEVSQTDVMQKSKEKAWQRFLELGLPTKESEVFQYIRLRTLYTHSFEAAKTTTLDPSILRSFILPECIGSVLIFINGIYQHELSNLSQLPKRLIVLPLNEATRTYGNFLNNQFTRQLKEDLDPFSMLNAALYEKGVFLYAPPKTVLDCPIQILQISANDFPMLMNPRIQGFIGSQSQLDLILTYANASENESLVNLSMELAIDEDSHVRYIQSPFDIHKKSWHFDAFRASLKRNSTLKTILATEGSTSLRNDYRISLIGENAEASLNGIWMLSDNNEAHAHILMDHQAPHCRSMQFFKSVLSDASRSSFEGKIYVRQAAQKTEAFQLNNNLLLSDQAKADSKPNLEIFADDVKASHGATMGQLDAEQLFYLRTRGYSEKAAKNLLVYGFCKEIIDLIPWPSLTDGIHKRAKSYLIQEA